MGFIPFIRGSTEKPNRTLICLLGIEEGWAEPTEGLEILICKTAGVDVDYEAEAFAWDSKACFHFEHMKLLLPFSIARMSCGSHVLQHSGVVIEEIDDVQPHSPSRF